MLSTTTARCFASWLSSTLGSLRDSVVVEGVLPVDIAGSREVELFSVHEVQVLVGLITCEGWSRGSEVATVPKRKSHRGLDLDLSLKL